MIQDDLLYRFRLRTFAMAAELAPCRAMGIHPHLLPVEAAAGPLWPRDPAAPGATGPTDGQPDQRAGRAAGGRLRSRPPRVQAGPDRRRARPAPLGRHPAINQRVWRVLRRHGLSTRAKRYGWWPATRPHRRLSGRPHHRSGIWTWTTLASWSSSTASVSGGCQGPRDPCRSTPPRCRLGLHLGHPAGDQAQPLGPLDQRPGLHRGRRPGQPRLAAGAWHRTPISRVGSSSWVSTKPGQLHTHPPSPSHPPHNMPHGSHARCFPPSRDAAAERFLSGLPTRPRGIPTSVGARRGTSRWLRACPDRAGGGRHPPDRVGKPSSRAHV